MSNADKQIVILDTDPGIDDAMALLYLAASPHIALHSVTTVFGNASVSVTTRNAQYIVERFGLPLPIHAGAELPLTGQRYIPDLRVHGDDGLGDSALSVAMTVRSKTTPAFQYICEIVLKNPGKVTLLAIGPLTNIALALRHEPSIARLVRQVVVMGGAFGTKGRHGNIRSNAEANFFYDPIAAHEVLDASWPLTVVGLDVTSDCILSSSQARRLADTSGDAGAFLWQISRGYEAIYRKFDAVDGCCIHDVAAAAYVTRPELFKRTVAKFEVGRSAQTWGHSAALRAGEPQDGMEKAYCHAVDSELLLEHFTTTINRYSKARGQPAIAR